MKAVTFNGGSCKNIFNSLYFYTNCTPKTKDDTIIFKWKSSIYHPCVPCDTSIGSVLGFNLPVVKFMAYSLKLIMQKNDSRNEANFRWTGPEVKWLSSQKLPPAGEYCTLQHCTPFTGPLRLPLCCEIQDWARPLSFQAELTAPQIERIFSHLVNISQN